MKRVISFVLVLALVLGSFSMAFAAPLTDVEDSANEAAITVVNDLGIVTGYGDGSFQPEKAVTRAEFAAMIVRALAIPESALAGYSSTSFKDTSGYGWAVKYLAFCEDKGIMLGDGQGNVMPGRTINMNEAVTMALRAIGLTDNSALLVGNWPANYVTLAKTNGLYDEVDAVTTVDRGTAAQIIYNLIKVDGFQVNADGETTQNEPTLLEGLCDTTPYKAVVDYDAPSTISITKYVGAYATIYENDGEIVAVDPISTFLTGEFNATADEFTTVDDVEYDVDAFTSAEGITNAKDLTLVSTADVATETAVTIAVDITGKTITKVYSVAQWTTIVTNEADEYVQDEINDDKTLEGVKFAQNKSKEIDDTKFELVGVASLDKIAEGDVIYVYKYGNADDQIVKIEVATATVEGKVTKIDGDDYTIGGEVYNLAPETTPTIKIGDKGTAKLNYAGEIYKWTPDETLVGNYAVLVATHSATSFGDTTNQVKLFTKEGTEITPNLSKDVTLASASALVGKIVDYALNSDGEVSELTNAETNPTLSGDVTANGALIADKKVAKNVIVFINDTGDYSIGKVADLADTVTVAAVIDDAEIVALLDDKADTGSEDAVYGIVNSYGAQGLDADDNKATLAAVILEADVKSEVIAKITLSESTTGTALYKFTVDEDGQITAVTTTGITVTSATTIDAIDGSFITIANGDTYELASDVIVYLYDGDATTKWSVGKVSQINKKTVKFFETDKDTDGYEYVIAW